MVGWWGKKGGVSLSDFIFHLDKAGEGGADLPVINEGIDLMRFESGRSVDLERAVVRSGRGRCSVDLDL